MNSTQLVLDNITDFINTTTFNSEEESSDDFVTNFTLVVLDNITDFINTTTVKSAHNFDGFIKAICWILGSIILFLCIAGAGFG